MKPRQRKPKPEAAPASAWEPFKPCAFHELPDEIQEAMRQRRTERPTPTDNDYDPFA